GAVTAAVLGAPISTALIVFEMTGDYALTLALMVTVVIASLITREFHGGSFFIWQLERQGHDLRDGLEMALLRKIPVNSILSAAVDPAPLSLAMPEIRCRLQTSEAGELFVIDQRGGLVGTITLADLDRFAFDGELDSLLVAGDVARRLIPHLISDDTLETALDVMADQGKEYLPVVDNNETMILLGSLRESRVRDAYNRALLQSQREQRGF
ncbi:MAG TPA: chloride channel protein, partial [Rhodospirillales bacterium]|nr:chloride channel protein [Rhodospirillales bacterium]